MFSRKGYTVPSRGAIAFSIRAIRVWEVLGNLMRAVLVGQAMYPAFSETAAATPDLPCFLMVPPAAPSQRLKQEFGHGRGAVFSGIVKGRSIDSVSEMDVRRRPATLPTLRDCPGRPPPDAKAHELGCRGCQAPSPHRKAAGRFRIYVHASRCMGRCDSFTVAHPEIFSPVEQRTERQLFSAGRATSAGEHNDFSAEP